MTTGSQFIVINDCHGGFGLSVSATLEYKRQAGITDPDWYHRDAARDDPVLVRVVQQLGPAADGACAQLKVVEIPNGVAWQIEENDGREWIAETHRTWR